MKRIVSMILVLALLLACAPAIPLKTQAATVASGTCGTNLTWTLDSAGTLTISGSGEMADYALYYPYTPWFSYCASIKTVIIGPDVTSIGDSAFYYCTGLTSVVIPNSVTSIGDYAFNRCTGLTSVTIGSSVETIGMAAFQNCTGLTSVVIPDSVTSIDIYAFENCTGLTSVTIGSSVETIDTPAFDNCTSLAGIWVNAGNAKYSSDEFGVLFNKDKTKLIQMPRGRTGSYIIPNSVKTIGNAAFGDCTDLTSVTIPSSVKVIGDYTFSGCSGLNEIYFEGSAPTIGYYAFQSATATAYYYPDETWTEDVRQNYAGTITWVAMEAEPAYSEGLRYEISDDNTYYIVVGIGECDDQKVIIPATYEGLPVKEIGNDAFGFDSGEMTSVVIPDSVTRIGDGAFGACYDLEEVVIGNGVTSIGAYAFVECTGLTSIEIPDSVISIGDNAFGSCSGLTEVTIGKSVSQIGSSVFGGCVALEQIVVDEENTSYCSDAYGVLYNSNKTSLICCPAVMTGTYTIPSTVTSIEAWAFGHCDELTAMEIPASVISIGDYAFVYCDELTAVVIPASVTSIGVDAFAYCTNLSEITFLGSAPAFADTDWNVGTFYKVNATAYYYPDATWTEDVRQNYGGTIFWEAMEVEPEIVASGTCGDNLIWSLDAEGILAIYGTGKMVGHPWDEFREDVKTVVIGDGVTDISDNAFTDYPNLTGIWVDDGNAEYSSDEYGVLFNKNKMILHQAPGALAGSYTIPDSVVSVSNYAFGYCANLTSVTIGNNVEVIGISAFVNCSGLTGELIIPDSVTSIGVGAFCDCAGLTSVTIGTGMKIIDAEAFSGCAGLKEISFAGSAPAIGDDAFQSVIATAYFTPDATWTAGVRQNYGGNITWVALEEEPEIIASGKCGTNLTWTLDAEGTLTISGTGTMDNYSINNMPPWCEYMESIRSVVVENGVTSVGDNAFNSCTSLTSLELSTTIQRIGNRAFMYCSCLLNVEIQESVTAIGDFAFTGCESLTSVQISKSVVSIGGGVFARCSKLMEIKVDPANGKYASDELGVLFNKNKTTLVCCPGGKEGTYVIPASVVMIGDYAFEGCLSLTNVKIPDSVTNIGKWAFTDCTGLSGTELPESVKWINFGAFSGCSSLTNIVIPDSVIKIYGCAFDNCTSLTRVTIGSSVSSIDSYAFSDCTGLYEIIFLGEAPQFSSSVFSGVTATAYYYPNETWTEDVRQNYGGNITWVALEVEPEIIASGTCGDNLTWTLDDQGTLTISGTGAMEDYTYRSSPWYDLREAVKTVVIANGVTSIGGEAFEYCENLTSVTIPDSVRRIGTSAFYYCTSLPSVTIGIGVETINIEAFYGCSSLTGIWVSNANTKYSSDESGVLFNKNKTELIQAPGTLSGSYTIPDSVTRIEYAAFYNCTSLTSVTIGNNVETIERMAFYGCTGLTSVTMGNSVTSIGQTAFYECASLTSVTFPNSVTTIDNAAFSCCYDLKEIYFEGSAPEIGFIAFLSVSAVAHYYPDETWTADTMQNYGGNITWIAKEEGAEIIASGTCGDNLTWKLDAEGTLTISGTGDMEGYFLDGSPWFAHRTKIKTVVIEPGVTSIGWYAFFECASLDTLVLSDDIKTIGGYAFFDCVGLSGELTIPSGVTAICSYAFAGCSGLTSVIIPASVTRIDYAAFTGKQLEEIYFVGSAPVIDDDAFSLVTATAYYNPDATWTEDVLQNYGGNITWVAMEMPKLSLGGEEFAGQDTVWIEGVPYPVQGEGEDRYIALPEAEEFLMVTYTYHEGDGQDVHTQYPTGMKVYQVKDGEITYIPELENLLQYSGSSIRITGKKGIRMITSIEKDKKNALTGKGLAGYTLVEYGTVLCFASEIPEGDGLVLGRDYARSNYAYKKGVADPVFATSGNLVQYTNVLVGFSLDQCKDDIAMRPYIILQNANGEQITLYGGTIYRSIGYIAYQNRNVFQPKTASYNYVWEIIHHVYGDKYDEEFKG